MCTPNSDQSLLTFGDSQSQAALTACFQLASTSIHLKTDNTNKSSDSKVKSSKATTSSTGTTTATSTKKKRIRSNEDTKDETVVDDNGISTIMSGEWSLLKPRIYIPRWLPCHQAGEAIKTSRSAPPRYPGWLSGSAMAPKWRHSLLINRRFLVLPTVREFDPTRPPPPPNTTYSYTEPEPIPVRMLICNSTPLCDGCLL
jgi:hypothetical protein